LEEKMTDTQQTENANSDGRGVAILERHGKIAQLIMDGAYTSKRKLNPTPPHMFPQMLNLIREFEDDEDLNVLIIRGAGDDAFTVGGDLRVVGPMAHDPHDVLERFHHPYREPLSPYVIRVGLWRLEIEKPVIAAVQGYCLGAGLILVGQHADLVVCADDASFGLTEIAHGMGGSAGARANLARHLPYRVAMKMVLMAESINAEEALRAGLVNEVVPKDKVFSTAWEWAEKIAAMPPIAIRAEKASLKRSLDLPYRDLMQLTEAMSILTHISDDTREGMTAFLEKRPAEFKGM
jgi:enoyl-CoA hydratase/carnithine racemase